MCKKDDLITYTQKHFQEYYPQKITTQEAEEILNNFIGFTKHILKLNNKRQIKQKNKGKNYDSKITYRTRITK